ncbi:hypothetical protein C8Q70DRAFT_370856 [Cubamyces menziesii]|nr:hypothetical protein C8Q70DRAFT_370856 [Cubamyces menziesii]
MEKSKTASEATRTKRTKSRKCARHPLPKSATRASISAHQMTSATSSVLPAFPSAQSSADCFPAVSAILPILNSRSSPPNSPRTSSSLRWASYHLSLGMRFALYVMFHRPIEIPCTRPSHSASHDATSIFSCPTS